LPVTNFFLTRWLKELKDILAFKISGCNPAVIYFVQFYLFQLNSFQSFFRFYTQSGKGQSEELLLKLLKLMFCVFSFIFYLANALPIS